MAHVKMRRELRIARVPAIFSEELLAALHYHKLSWHDFTSEGEFKYMKGLLRLDEAEAYRNEAERNRELRRKAKALAKKQLNTHDSELKTGTL